MKPFVGLGLGIHPDRVTKLVRSTDIVPGWLDSRGHAPRERLSKVLAHWHEATKGAFI
jgi:hypothetical protein